MMLSDAILANKILTDPQLAPTFASMWQDRTCYKYTAITCAQRLRKQPAYY